VFNGQPACYSVTFLNPHFYNGNFLPVFPSGNQPKYHSTAFQAGQAVRRTYNGQPARYSKTLKSIAFYLPHFLSELNKNPNFDFLNSFIIFF